ncbi:Inner membrane transporter rhtA [Candidatus Johnevansia muelleri]|uniref:Inner membrane transporter rhtA n=1 Tax=Candidatus Johnevansia muelleri TaxID=1495769 RepID=A0A078KHM3_9GAMM|nr:Inner membrane transporter rhtA [Candidatus Evansia muelleri]
MEYKNIPLIILLIMSMLSIQSGASIAKNLFTIIGVQGTTMMRLFIASIIFTIIFKPWNSYYSIIKNWFLIMGYGISIGAMNLLFYMSLKILPLCISVSIEFIGPLSLALFSSKRLIDFVWVFIVIISIIILIPLKLLFHKKNIIGIFYGLGSGFFWALYIIFGKKATAKLDKKNILSIGIIIAFLFSLPFGLINSWKKLLSFKILYYACIISIFSTVIPYTIELIAINKLPIVTFGTLTSLEPVVAAISGLIFLHEKLSIIQGIALFAIILASIGSTLTIETN